MISEQLEFQISQYADGTLPAAEVAALEALLAVDADAAALLAEYRALDATLKRDLPPLPAVNFDRLAEHLSRAVEAEDRATTTFSISAWWVRSAVAAVIVLTAGAAVFFQARRSSAPTEVVTINPPPAPAPTAVALVEISGPSAELAAGQPVVEISIDATPLAKRSNYGVSETIVYRPPRMVAIASGPAERQDTPLLPY